METSKTKTPRQSLLFPESHPFFDEQCKPLPKTLNNIGSDDNQYGRINHMSKFKPFYKFERPLVVFSQASFLDYVNGVIPEEHLCRLVKQVVFSLDTKSIEKGYSFLG